MSIFTPNSDFKSYLKENPVTVLILFINTILLLLTLLTGGFSGLNLVNLGGLHPPLVTENGEYYRLLTTMFLHGSILHFLSNMIIGVYVLSSGLERLIGSVKFALLYFLAGIGASIIIVLVTNNLTIGASGAIFGVLGAYLYIIVNKKEMIDDRDKQSLLGLVAMNVFFTFVMPGISIAGHIGGLISGYLLGFVLNIKSK